MTPRIVRLSLVVLLLALAPGTSGQPPGPSPTPGASPLVPRGDDPMVSSVRFADDTVDQVLSTLSTLTGRSILRSGLGLPPGQYTLDLRNKPRSTMIVAIETSLMLNGIAISPLGDDMMVVTNLQAAKSGATEMISGSTLALPPSGKIATKVFQLEFLRVQEFIVPLASILNTQVANMVVIERVNAAMITDSLFNLQRIERLMKELDKPAPGMSVKTYQLLNGSKASDVVNTIRAAFGATIQQQLGTATTFSAVDRTNQVILISDPRIYPVFDELIAKLDIKADPNTGTDIIPLKHAKAADVQALLNKLVQGQVAAAQRNAQSVRPGQIVLPNQPPQLQLPLPNANLGGPLGAPQGPGVQANNTPPPLAGPMGIESPSGTNEFSTIFNVVNDDRSNSIIVSGTADDIRLIKELVAKIDTILAQVNIEVIIAEVTLNDTQKSGLEALGLTVATDAPGGRGTHITEFAGNVAGWAVTEGVVNPLAFKAALTNTGDRSNLKILSVPTITTTHGKPGLVKVGEKRPIITSTVASNNTGGTSSQYTLQDIALTLTVTPLIGDDGSIQLEIDQVIDDVIGTVAVDQNQVPIIGTRQAKAFLNVFDGDIRVLGGLQRTKNGRRRNKIGFIYEIPILSHLLGARTNTVERTELLIFIRPHVLRENAGNAEALQAIGNLSNKEQIQQFLKDPSVRAKDSILEKLK